MAHLGREHSAAEPRRIRAAAHTAVAIAPPRFCGHFRFLPRCAAFGAGFRPAAPDKAEAGGCALGYGAAAGLRLGDVGLHAAAGRAPIIEDAKPRGSRR